MVNNALAQQLRQAADLLAQGQPPTPHLSDLLLRAADIICPPVAENKSENKNPSIAQLVLEADGGSRGNPGPAGAGAVLRLSNGEIVKELSRFLGHATNNVAEYQALIMGLQAAAEYAPPSLWVKLDSELLVRQLQGRYQVKSPHLQPLYEQAKALLAGFAQVRISHIARQYNQLADALANQAMDLHKKI